MDNYNRESELKHIYERLQNARIEYNNNGENLEMTDEEYDALLALYFRMGGTQNPELIRTIGGEITLDYSMSSLNKIEGEKALEKITKFMENNPGQYIISDKIDGTSLQCKYENGFLQITTGGDSVTGFDVSYMKDYINIPKNLQGNYVIRGELTIDNTQFESVTERLQARGLKATNSRSIVNGMVNRKTPDFDILGKCTFVAFDILSEVWPLSVKFEFLSANRFVIPSPIIYNPTTPENLLNDLKQYRKQRVEQSKFRLDGIVVVSDPNSTVPPEHSNPKHAFAFKENTIAFSRVLYTRYRIMSRYGNMTPVVYFDPTTVIGNEYKSATAHNARFLMKHGIVEGTLIAFTPGGDVIPKILFSVEGQGVPLAPDIPFHWNKNGVELVLDNYQSYPQVQIAQMVFFVTSLGIEGCGETTMLKFFEAGITDIGALIRVRADFLEQLERMGEKSSSKLVESIRQALERITYPLLMAASGIFPEGLGKTVMGSFIENFPDWEFRNPTYEEILSKHGFGPVRSEQIAECLPEFKIWLERHPECRPKPKIKRDVPRDLLNEIIVCTGFDLQEIQKQELQDRGATIKDSWVNGCTILLVKQTGKETGKLAKAQSKMQEGGRIQILPYTFFG